MKPYSLTHLTDHSLLQVLTTLVTRDRATTAELLAHLAEVDERKLYLPAAYSSMFAYCVQELRMSEDMASKRIQAGRAARRSPAIFPMVADGRLHLTAVVLLAPHLEARNVDELLAAATDKSITQLRLLLAKRFPQPDAPTFVRAIVPAAVPGKLIACSVDAPVLQLGSEAALPCEGAEAALQFEPVLKPVVPAFDVNVPTQMGPHASQGKLMPLSPGRFALQVTVDQATYDQLRYAQELLGHALPTGDIAAVLHRGLDALVCKLEMQKFAKSARWSPRRSAANGRYVPTDVRHTVWQRDGGQCTFVSESGKRCEARTRIEFDHVEVFARGGQTTAANLRLRCRPHNQHTAEQTFGVEFMSGKRAEARRRAAEAKAKAQAKARTETQARKEEEARAKADAKAQAEAQTAAPAEAAREQDVIPWLRALGYNAETARRGAAACAHIPDASLEERVRVALRALAPNCVRRAAPVASTTP